MIRQAVASDAVKAVPLSMQAIGHIAFVLTGTTDSQEAASILSHFFGQEDNRISYQNALVMEEEGEVVGVAIFYDGALSKRRAIGFHDFHLHRRAPKSCDWSAFPICLKDGETSPDTSGRPSLLGSRSPCSRSSKFDWIRVRNLQEC
jgi:hypothetical protein